MEKMVVIVDDDKDLLDMLVFSFESEGFAVKGLESKSEALAFLSDHKNFDQISLLILDRMLPDGDGLDILREVQPAIPKQTPILVLSVLSSEKDVLSGLKHGAVDYIAKPFSLPVLIRKALGLISRGSG